MKNLLVLFILLAVTASSGISKEVKVAGYKKKDGTVVKGYMKTIKDKDSDTVEVKGYTKKDGTKVAEYKRKKAK
jgi:hypothetical protein